MYRSVPLIAVVCLLLFSLQAGSQSLFRTESSLSIEWDTLAFSVTRKTATPLAVKEGLRKNFSYLSIVEKLDVSHIFSVCVDSKQNVWLGGNFGEVVRYNGIFFEYYHFEPFESKKIFAIHQDSKGNIWFGSFDGGLIKFDGINACYMKPHESFSVKEIGVWDIFQDEDGTVWVCTMNNGLIGIHEEKFVQYNTHDGLIDNQVTCGTVASDGNIWIGYYRNGITRLSPGKNPMHFDVKNGLSDNTVFVMDSHGNDVIIGTKSGLNVWSESNGLAGINQFEDIAIMDMECDSDGQLWLATNGNGLYNISIANNEINWDDATHYGYKDGLTQERLVALAADSDHNVWIGTYGNGLLKKSPDVFLNYDSKSGLPNDKPWSLCLKDDGNLLVGFSGGGVSEIHNDSIFDFNKIPALANLDVHDIYQEQNGNLWFGASELGVFELENSKAVQYPFSQQVKSKQPVKDIFEIESSPGISELLFASFNGLLHIQNGELENYTLKQGQILLDLNQSAAGVDGKTWLASSNGIFCVYKQSSTDSLFSFVQLNEQIGLNEKEITCIHANEKYLVAGTKGSGVYFFEYEKISNAVENGIYREIKSLSCDEAGGLSSSIVLAIYQDSKGNYWLGVNNGVNRIASSTLEKAFIDHAKTLNVAWYSLQSGLVDPAITFNNVVEDNSGKIWWCTNSSLAAYDPASDFADASAPVLDLTQLDLFFEEVNWQKDYRISAPGYFKSLWNNYITFNQLLPWSRLPLNPVFSHDQNHLTFQFNARDWFCNSSVEVRILLSGLEKNWQTLDEKNSITYSSIPPGEYVLKLQAVNRNGKSGEIVEYPFTIALPFWNTAWFYALVGSLVLLTLYGIYKWRVRKLEREKRVLEKRVENRTEELRKEKNKSDNLLLNILPKHTAEELKERGAAETKSYASASVLFSDFKGFTGMTETLNSIELVSVLDQFFKAFDDAAGKYRIEKIKTIGDAYMCAAGLPIETKTHAIELVAFGLEMLYSTEQINLTRIKRGAEPWPIRIGIHSGSLIAGVVGKRKFAYDIWGDTVNTAARMESASEAGKLNISRTTLSAIEGYFDTESRGKIHTKGKGEIEMFFVKGFNSQYRSIHSDLLPNELFQKQALRFD